MVTERGSVLSRTVLSEKIQKQNSRTLFTVALICLIVGSIGVAAYIIVSSVLETRLGEAPVWCNGLLVFAAPFTFGLIFVLTVHSVVRQAKRSAGTTVEVTSSDL